MSVPTPPVPRRVLLLQGPASFFFTYLGRALGARGADVHRVLLCPGDRIFWRSNPSVAYRDRPEKWPGHVAYFANTNGITDLVCLGDGRRWHRDAIAALQPLGVRIHVIEQGYLRPHRLTIERDGTGGHSRFPRTWPEIDALASGEPSSPPAFQTSFANYAVMDVAWNLANLLTAWLFYPHYRTHSIDGPPKEWAGWIVKAVTNPLRRRNVARANARIARHQGPLFLMALQLETDFQIRLHGPAGGLRAALADVIASFAVNAPPEALLVVKRHPLDNGWAGWRRQISEYARTNGVTDRVIDLDGGDLDQLLGRSTGLLTVNSTVGLTALQQGVPVKVLGNAIYDLPGLCHQGPLARFWTDPDRVDPDLCQKLVRALEASIQVNGNFDGSGAVPGAEAMAARILG